MKVGQRVDARADVVAWCLLVSGTAAVVVWFSLWLLPGGFAVIDAPSFGEGVETGLRYGTVETVLLVLAVAAVVTGVRILRRGRAGLDRPMAVAVVIGCSLAAVAQSAWLLAVAVSVVGAAVLLALRHPAPRRMASAG